MWAAVRDSYEHWGLAAGVTLLVVGCAHGRDPQLGALQRATLETVYYRGNPAPPAPSAEEIAAAQARLDAAPVHEGELLRSLFPHDPELVALAMRDTDGDGLLDYQISDYYGRFLEGDTDLDGDGVDNVLDPAPYDGKAPAKPVEGIPGHVDWKRQGKPESMVRIQRELFEDHGVLLVERTADFTESLGQAVYDTMTRIYRSVFREGTRPTPLRVVSTERSSLLYADAEEGEGDFAMALALSGTVEIYQESLDAPPVFVLGVLAHEFGHMFEAAMDQSPDVVSRLFRGDCPKTERFDELVDGYGWDHEQADENPAGRYATFRPIYEHSCGGHYTYLGKDADAWDDWLMQVDASQHGFYLADPRVVEHHIVGSYALASPSEWLGDHLIAYVYLSMLDSLDGSCTTSGSYALAAALRQDLANAGWADYRFINALGAPIQDWLHETYPIATEDLSYLTGMYLLDGRGNYCAGAAQRRTDAAVTSAPPPTDSAEND